MSRVILLLGFGLAVVASTVQAGSIPPELENIGKLAHDACITEAGPSEETIKSVSDGIFPEDDVLKCYIKCMLTHIQVIDEDNFNYEAMKEFMPESMRERASLAVDKCRDITGKDTCDKAFNLAKCVQQHDPEDFFIP